jgi:hypothetical protein
VKVKGGVTRTQSLKGTISKADLLALVRETFAIPDNAKACFYIIDNNACYSQAIMMGSSPMPSPLVDVTDTAPLHFIVDWELPDAREQG